jgi:hypothetical protein
MIYESEITNQIYDTLMGNEDENHPKFDNSIIDECEVDANNCKIRFTIGNEEFEIIVHKIAVRK